jgi:hypothetical protein
MRLSLMTRLTTLVDRGTHAVAPVAMVLGMTLLATSRAEAQYGYAGTYGAVAGYGAGMGMTLADQMLLKEQIYSLNASQFQLNQVQAEREFWSAVLIREQAISTALYNRKLAAEFRDSDVAPPVPAKDQSRRWRGTVPARVVRRTLPVSAGIPAVAHRDTLNPNIPRR